MYDWRQWDTFSVVRNFRHEGMNPLSPRTNEFYVKTNKTDERLFLLDFPIYSYLAATLSYIFGVSVFTLRLINIVSGSLTTTTLFWGIVHLTGNFKAGMISAILLNLSPLFQFASVSMQPDMLMLLFFTASIYFLLKDRPNHLLATSFLTLSVLIKPYILIVVLPLIIYLLLKTKKINYLLYATTPVIAYSLWVLRGMGTESGRYWYSAQTWVLTMVNSWGFDLPEITALMLRNITVSILTIPIIFLAILGFTKLDKVLREKILMILLGFVLFLILLIPGNYNHLYYQLPLLIPSYFLASLGISSLTRRELAVMVLAVPIYYYPSKTLYTNLFRQNQIYIVLNSWQFEQQLIPESKTVIYYNDEKSPVILNMMGRNGWVFDIKNSICNEEQNRLKTLNADYVLIFKYFINRQNKIEVSDDSKIVECLTNTMGEGPKYQDKYMTVIQLKK